MPKMRTAGQTSMRAADSVSPRRKEHQPTTTVLGGLIDRMLNCIRVVRAAVTLAFDGYGARIIRRRFEGGRCSDGRPASHQQGGSDASRVATCAPAQAPVLPCLPIIASSARESWVDRALRSCTAPRHDRPARACRRAAGLMSSPVLVWGAATGFAIEHVVDLDERRQRYRSPSSARRDRDTTPRPCGSGSDRCGRVHRSKTGQLLWHTMYWLPNTPALTQRSVRSMPKF